jgi:hypothetical protein
MRAATILMAARINRACFIDAFQLGRRFPQGLKPAFLQAQNGTAEAVPCPKPIYEIRSTHSMLLNNTTHKHSDRLPGITAAESW